MLTTCQKSALQAFKKFIRAEPSVMTIAGDAGCGKSMLISEMEEYVKEHNNIMLALDMPVISEVIKCAPTNFAADIIGGKTIHKSFDISFRKHSEDRLMYLPWDTSNRRLYIVDECSMVSKELYNLMIQRAKETNSYIVFLGDLNQLFPVKESLSNTFRNHKFHKMITVVRQDTQSDLYKSIQLAKLGINDFNITLSPNKDVKIIDNEEDFRKLLVAEFNDKPSNAQVLVYSNARANTYKSLTHNEKFVYYGNQPVGTNLTGFGKEYSKFPVTTIHKAQGRTYHTVYIDYRDILTSREHRRLFYVALSRASHKAIILV